MFKWHVHSAIGRGRPIASDLSRVSDGIAASLRQFSISASRPADNEGPAPPSRSQRVANAIREVSALAPAPTGGIDARSLAAKPPPRFTIRRVDDSPSRSPRVGGSSFTDRRSLSPSRGGMRGGPARRGGMSARGGQRGGAAGRGRGRGRGGARGRRGGRASRDSDEDATTYDQYTKEEADELADIEGGYTLPWKPTMSMESLTAWMPAVITGSRGLVHTANYKMAVATGNIHPSCRNGEEHVVKMNGGIGTLFQNKEERDALENYDRTGKLSQELLKKADGWHASKFGSLSQSDRDALNKQWIAGQYVKPKAPQPGDILGQVEVYARLNETYLPADSKSLDEALRSRIPAQNQTSKSKREPQPAI